MVACSVKYCRSDGRMKDKTISFFSFPWKVGMRAKWVENIGRRNDLKWRWNPNRRVCSKHFRNEDIIFGPICTLRHGALPLLLLPKEMSECVQTEPDTVPVSNISARSSSSSTLTVVSVHREADERIPVSELSPRSHSSSTLTAFSDQGETDDIAPVPNLSPLSSSSSTITAFSDRGETYDVAPVPQLSPLSSSSSTMTAFSPPLSDRSFGTPSPPLESDKRVSQRRYKEQELTNSNRYRRFSNEETLKTNWEKARNNDKNVKQKCPIVVATASKKTLNTETRTQHSANHKVCSSNSTATLPKDKEVVTKIEILPSDVQYVLWPVTKNHPTIPPLRDIRDIQNKNHETEAIQFLNSKLKKAQEKVTLKTRQLSTLRTKLKRAEIRIDKLKKQVKSQLNHKCNFKEEWKCALEGVSPMTTSLLKRELFKKIHPNTHQIFDDFMKGFALSVHHLSPETYTFIRKAFGCLPHPSTMNKWCAEKYCDDTTEVDKSIHQILNDKNIANDNGDDYARQHKNSLENNQNVNANFRNNQDDFENLDENQDFEQNIGNDQEYFDENPDIKIEPYVIQDHEYM